MKRFLPAPLLSAALMVSWLLLNEPVSRYSLVVALLAGLVIPVLLLPLRPASRGLRRPLLTLRLILTVGFDVLRSGLEVGHGILRLHRLRPRGAFATIPLEIRDANALAALAVITTVVPGTVWCELAPDRSALRLHVFDLKDEEAFVTYYKARYEQPLKEIFE
ncbi:MAG: Na+/H+ antiporter subunit E [Burkholderiaceae bacterium]